MSYIIVLLVLISPNLAPHFGAVQEPAPQSAQQPETKQSKPPTPGPRKSKGNPPSKKPSENTQVPKPNATPAEQPAPKPQAPQRETVPANAPEKPEKKTSPDWWLVYFTGALVLVGAIQVIAMLRQEKWMRRNVQVAQASADAANATVKTMQDVAEKQLRAYVYVVKGGRHIDEESGETVTTLGIKNAGQTPAYECSRYMIEAVSNKYPQLPEDFDKIPIDEPTIKSPIPPGETVEFFETAETLTLEQEVQIQSGRAAIYLFGRITYRDAFGKEQVTNYRFECTGDNFTRGRFAPCDQGNEAT